MALVDREQMRDATGAVHLYRPVPDSTPGVPPEYPHPDATHQARTSGRGLHPCFHLHPLADQIAWYTDQGLEPDMPVDGDQTARWKRLQCWDDQTGRQPDRKFFSGSDPCENPDCPHPRPHCAGQWFSEHWPRFRDIAHVLYPGGVLPVPVRDEPTPEPTPPATPEPEQLDMLAYLEEMTS